MAMAGGQADSAGNAYQNWAVARSLLAIYCRKEGLVRANLPPVADIGGRKLILFNVNGFDTRMSIR